MTPPSAFVRVRGPHFELAGRPYRFAGVNFWHAAYLGRPGAAADRARLARELDQLRLLGVTNLRILAASEPSPHSPLTPAFQPRPREYNEELLRGLDFALAEMGARGMQAVLYLSNEWEWSGGFATLVEWVTGTTRPPSDQWPATLRFDNQFYLLPEAQALYLDYARMLLTRRNTVTGRRYAEDPAIMSWQLANEPRAGDAGDLARFGPGLLAWARTASRLVRELAPHQLISTGSEGVVASDRDLRFYRDLHAPAEIDYLTIHTWPFNWQWYRPTDESTLAPSLAKAAHYLALHLGVARELGKPLVLEEFGLARDGGARSPWTPTTARDRFVRQVCDQLREARDSGSPFCGCNLWTWSGEGTPVHPEGAPWREGHPLGGDNPIEPQGLNAVYSSDLGTLSLLHEINRVLRSDRAPAPAALPLA